jgi:succinate dehydrogenase / fumarate reductase, cytochrome b subunit
MAKSVLIKSSIGKKYWMALTGLFLISFLTIHLLGNFQLLKNDGGDAFNVYAKFMTTFLPIKIVSYLLYGSILFHAIDGFLLAYQNRKARPVRYAMEKGGANSGWHSRSMALLGTLILIFIVTHMAQFWAQMKFGFVREVPIEGEMYKDLYTLVALAYSKTDPMGIFWTIAYVFSMVVLAFHLWHGYSSAFQTLGIRHKKFQFPIKLTSYVVAFGIPLGFAIIPIIMYIKS